MTNEEAIFYLTLYKRRLECSVSDLDEDIKAYDMALEALKQQRTGKWIVMSSEICKCSKCKLFSDKMTKFCPNCGAKMDLEVKENGSK